MYTLASPLPARERQPLAKTRLGEERQPVVSPPSSSSPGIQHTAISRNEGNHIVSLFKCCRDCIKIQISNLYNLLFGRPKKNRQTKVCGVLMNVFMGCYRD
jgi:hypothetical protein